MRAGSAEGIGQQLYGPDGWAVRAEKALAPHVTQPDREVLPAHTALSEVYLFTIP